MNTQTLMRILGADFYTGVPDSQLKALCNELIHTYGTHGPHHIIGANEGNCTAMAAGYHLATGKIPVVYMQNSGQGNILNPVASLCHPQVYGIPMIFVVGWRGQPGIHDEPQHIFQGAITQRLMEDLEIPALVLRPETGEEALTQWLEAHRQDLQQGRQLALIVTKGALTSDVPTSYANDYSMTREQIIRQILSRTGDDPIVCTTGKASRELFELRQAAGQDHSRDFLTVGSMGHSSSIALGIALQKPEQRLWCIDGDGAAIMHMGAMAVIGALQPRNLVHIVINNGAHETVGGMPTAAFAADLCAVAKACGYPVALRAETPEQLDRALDQAGNALTLIEVRCAIGARADLGRPTTTPAENKHSFMDRLQRP